MGKISRFLAQGYAILTGDKDKERVLYNFGKAKAAIKKQLANLDAELLDKQQELEAAQEALKAAKIPTDYKITDPEGYLRGIKNANEKVTAAQEAIDNVNFSIKYYTDLQTELTEEVDA